MMAGFCVANGESVVPTEDANAETNAESCKNDKVTDVDDGLPKHMKVRHVKWTARKLGAKPGDDTPHASQAGLSISKLLTPIPAPTQPMVFTDVVHEDVLKKWTPKSLRKILRGPFNVAISKRRTLQVYMCVFPVYNNTELKGNSCVQNSFARFFLQLHTCSA